MTVTVCYPMQQNFSDCLTLKLKVLRCFETSRDTCYTTQLHVPDDFSLHQQRCVGLETRIQFLRFSLLKKTRDSPWVSKLSVWPSHSFSLRPLSSLYVNAAMWLHSDRKNLLALKWDIQLRERQTSTGNTTDKKNALWL